MKNKIIFSIVLFSLGLSLSCMQKQSALNRLVKAGEDPVEAMRLPEKPETSTPSKNNSPIKETMVSDKFSQPEKIRTNTRKIIASNAMRKQVNVLQNNTPLRKGPGNNFPQLAVAQKGHYFLFLSQTSLPGSESAWYLVQDRNNNKYYISSAMSSISLEKKVIRSGETLKKAQKINPSGVKHVRASEPKIPLELRNAKHITLNFEDTEIYDVITTFCRLLEMDYMVEGEIQGKVTLQTFNKIPVEDLYSVFEQVLAINNITVLKSGEFYRFVSIKDSARKPLSLYYGNDASIPSEDRMIIQIIPIKYLTSDAIKKVIQPLLSTDATLTNIPETNHIMLIELASNVDKVLRLVQVLDLDKLADSEIQLFKILDSDAEMMTEELTEIFTSIGYGEELGKKLSFLPIQRLNSILAVNSLDNVMPTIEFWIEKLDQPTAERRHSTFVYYVQNADAEKMTSILTSIFEGQKQNNIPISKKLKPASAKSPAKQGDKTKQPATIKKPVIKTKNGISGNLHGEITIIPDTDTNAVITRTDPRNYPAILELIKKLDLMPQQVLIEVLILDLTLDDETRLGLEWAMQGSSGGTTLAGGTAPLPAPGGSTLGSMIGSAITPIFAPGASFFVQNPGKIIALLQAFASDSKVNVISNPILVTSDNREANISISDDIPIESTTLVTNTVEPVTSTTIEFRNVGIKLGILPKINSDNYVNLKINQEISSLGPVIGTTPSFSVRTIETEVVLKDNQILVMGGLMRTTTSESNNGVPGLKDIPYIGKLFSTDSVGSTKTELMLFITPHIMSNTKDSNFITNQFKKRLDILKKPSQTDGTSAPSGT